MVLITQITTEARAILTARREAESDDAPYLVVKTPYEYQVMPVDMAWCIGPYDVVTFRTDREEVA